MKNPLLLFLAVSSQQQSYGFLQVSTPLAKNGGNLPLTTSSLMMTASTLVEKPNLNDGDQVMKEKDSSTTPPRPLQQNWWPVVAITALDSSRPNSINVLEKDLVIFKSDSTLEDDDSYAWTILDDRCSHRFAPLSEGRVIPLSSNQDTETGNEETKDCSGGGSCGIQCAYHGWEFDSTGTCAKVPQDPSKTNKARSIQKYPCQVAAGIVWIWTDPDTYSTIGQDIRLPINPLLEKVVEQFGPASCYMRDLPYGMEILGENLLDLSHLPFAHHSVGSLTRSLGQELPTKMMTKKEREEYAEWEAEVGSNNKDDGSASESQAPVVPLYQAKIIDAAKHDPILMGLASQVKNETITQNWETTISFFDPCHVRYRRSRGPGIGLSSHVELFLCPSSESRSRVFLFNIIGSLVKEDDDKQSEANGNTDKSLVFQRLAPIVQRLQRAMKPSSWKIALLTRMIRRNVPFGHRIAHQIFDGDGIFLHYQGNRMKAADLTFRDYSTPSSCDVLLNAYRRFLDSAARNTADKQIASAVIGSGMYGQNLQRSEMLDRYNTHTKHCPDCLSALQRTRQAKTRNGIATTALLGSAGASTVISLLSFFAAQARRLTLLSVAVSGVFWIAVKLLLLRERKLDKSIQSFLFEDYVHSEKV